MGGVGGGGVAGRIFGVAFFSLYFPSFVRDDVQEYILSSAHSVTKPKAQWHAVF